ncbi:MAG: autotransporter assembly complex family protein [Gammaproteobacteria bacterium]|nr:autotransporter assembly complex family protein [Gammaproteobacteria bacterium]
MNRTQQMLLTLLTCLCSTGLFAQVTVDIKISGLSEPLEENARLFLTLAEVQGHTLLSEGRMRHLHKKAPQEIADALKPYGYYRADIKSRLTQTSPEQWQAHYSVDPGPPVRIGEFNFNLGGAMKDDPEAQTLINNFPLREGYVLNHSAYKDIKESLAELARERGYFDAELVTHQIEIDLEAYKARIYLDYDSGPRYDFGEVQLEQDVLDPEFLQRYIHFHQGEPYELNELINFQHALNDSDYFQSVEVSPGQPKTESLRIPVDVSLTPRKRHRFTLGLGYGTDTGARTRFGWEMPRVNKKGHRFDTELRVSEIGYSLTAHYRVPVFNPRTDQIVYSAGIIDETTDTSESNIRTIGVSLNHSRRDWRESISLNYQQEEFIIANVRGDSTLLMPGASWSRTWGNDFINTFDGLRFDFSMRGASKKVISDTDFMQLLGGIKFITSLSARNRIIARGRLGSTLTQDFEQLPSSVRFFAGGSQSVRGYAYESLGPVDANGLVIGGKNLMVGSIEYDYSIGDQWSVALFYDGGNAIDNLSDDLERGAGFGFRWKSPVGPVRIDFASAITRAGNPWRIHINIGPDL